ncbi:MAG: hypothetical protein OER12_02060 [Acidimicrobiia bacterium]|nr:hypothetical protein [Acidimicrobiia bacterium]
MSQETEYLNILSAASGLSTSLTGLELLEHEGVTVAEYRFGGRIR